MQDEAEYWYEIPFAEGYQLSCQSRLRSRWRATKSGAKLVEEWRIIKGSTHPLGYVRHVLSGRSWWLHRIVAFVFKGDPPFDRAEARHMDGNPMNNHPSNIEWGSHAENGMDMKRHGTQPRGEQNHGTKLKNFQAIEIYNLGKSGVPHKDLAASYGVSKSTISRIVCGTKWQTVTGATQAA